MLAKKLSSYFFLSFFLCAFVGKICEFVFCEVTQNNIRHPKSLMINYIIIQINFLGLLC